MLPVAVFCFIAIALAASPQVSYPLNLQLPPVARVGKPYSFQFAATTFQPNPDRLVYSIASGPPWLHLHSENRTLYGTPEVKDAGTATFTITAAGEAGVFANLESQLPVEKDDGPSLAGNISQALAKAGQLSGLSSVTLLPSKPFEITFGKGLFENEGKDLSYHATLKDHTPLPAWISFDPDSLRLTGTTPSSASPQTIDILLIVSEDSGFAAASILFSIDVSNHLLLFKPLQQTVSVSKGEHVIIKGLKGLVFLDNVPIRDDDIQTASADIPKWLSFDANSFVITGDPPSGLMSQDVSVTVQDKFGDTAQHSIHLSFTSQLFTSEVGRLNVTPGVSFEHQVPRSIVTLDGESVSFEFGALGKWLRFDPQSFIISGSIPNDTGTCSIEGSMTATSPDGKVRDTQTFQIDVLGTTTSGTSNPLNSSTGSGTHTENAVSNSGSSSRKRTGIIVGAVLASLFGAAVIVVLALSLCHRRRKHEKGYLSPNRPRSPRKTDISRPILKPHISIASGWGEIDKADDDVEKGKLDLSPPQINDLPTKTLPEKKIGHSRDTSLNEREDDLCTWLHQDVTFSTDAGPSHHPHDSMKLPTEMLRRKSAGSPSRQQRQHTRTGSSAHRISNPPLPRRLTSLSRARHTPSPSHGTSSSNTTALSTMPSAPLQLSHARHTTHLTTPLSARPSIRSVVPSTYVYEAPSSLDRLIDRRTLDEKRHSYIRKRASAQQSPLFAGSRVSSSSFKVAPKYLEASPTEQRKQATTIVRPDDSLLSEASSVPSSLRIRKPGETPSPTPSPSSSPAPFDLSKSLRKKSSRGVFTHRFTSPEQSRDLPSRPSTALYNPPPFPPSPTPPFPIRSSTLLLSLNTATASEIWYDTDRSESNYSGDDLDILEASRRTTLRPPSATNLPPIIPLDVVKRKPEGKRTSHRGSSTTKPAMKRTSERDPTPFHARSAEEHGGKENVDVERGEGSPPKEVKARRDTTSTSMPLSPRALRNNTPSTAPASSTNNAQHPSHTRAPSRALPPLPPPTQPPSPSSQPARKPQHSRSASRHSATLLPSTSGKNPRERSTTQDSAYPFFSKDTSATSTTTTTSTSSGKRDSTATTRARRSVGDTRETRESGEVRGKGTGMGRVRVKRESPFYHSNRDTVVGVGVGVGVSGWEEVEGAWGRKGKRRESGSGSPGRMSVWGGDVDAKALV